MERVGVWEYGGVGATDRTQPARSPDSHTPTPPYAVSSTTHLMNLGFPLRIGNATTHGTS